MEKTYQEMELHELADVIRRDWGQVNYAAVSYLDAMRCIRSVDDMYGADTGQSIVAYFLANAGTWRGETAREVKKELRRRVGL